MTECKLIRNEFDELRFDANYQSEIDTNYLKEANGLLQRELPSCRKELAFSMQTRVDRNAGILAIAFAVIACAVTVVLSISVDWGFCFIALPSLALLGFGIYAIYKANEEDVLTEYILTECEVYCARLAKESFSLSQVYVTFEVYFEGHIVTAECSMPSLGDLQDNPIFIVAYDKQKNKFVPIKLYAEPDISGECID